jgi:hypothetical protein
MMVPTAIAMTVLSHPLQVVLMAMVAGKLVRMAVSGHVERPDGERVTIRTPARRQAA